MTPRTTLNARSVTRSAPPQLIEVAERVWAYEQPHGGWCVNNSGLLGGDEGVVVIDTVATQARANRLRDTVDRLPAGPRRTLVNTHHHGDHVFGNSLFSDRATIIAHELARKEMAETGLALTGLFPDVDWGELSLALPSVTMTDRLTVFFDGDRTAELIHVGPAHTTNDVVVWLPAERVLFTGDVVMSGCSPFNLMGSITGALQALDRLRALAPLTVISGHGPVAGPEVLDVNQSYLRWVQSLAEHGRAEGLSALQTATRADLGEFAELLDQERLVGNLHRAYAELDGGELGRPLDVVAAFGEMIEYNGGQTPTCLA